MKIRTASSGKIFTFGEIMLRLSPHNKGERIAQASVYRIEPGGSEANVAIALAKLGHRTSYLTRIPDGQFKKKIFAYLRQHDVGISQVVLGGKRLGVYWTENGIGPRPTSVIYDRDGSSFSDSALNDYNWEYVNKNAFWFHASGITPAISNKSCHNLLGVLDVLKKDIKISIDLNYREKLWRWIDGDRKKAIKDLMNKICNKAYLITANEEDLHNALGFPVSLNLTTDSYRKIAKSMFRNMRNLCYLAISLRKSYSASENDWTGLLFVRDDRKTHLFKSQRYKLNNIVDRIGTGDSFTAGTIHGIIRFKNDYQRIVDFSTMLSALNHTVLGDASQFDEDDVINALASRGRGRVVR